MIDLLSQAIINQLLSVNFSRPLTLLDLSMAISLIVGFFLYLKRFPVFRVVVGTLFLLLCAQIFLLAGFVLTGAILSFTSSLILISLPFIFAPEIRHYLEKLGRFSFLKVPRASKRRRAETVIGTLVGALFELSERKTGALVILQRRTNLGHLTESGVLLDASLGAKILGSIFYPNSPLHDGAVVVEGDRVLAARCTVPISDQIKLDPPLGLRHKAALSATRETDAISLIVSEQRGEVSLAENGKLYLNLTRASLADRLTSLLS